jgi:hypothetical protein
MKFEEPSADGFPMSSLHPRLKAGEIIEKLLYFKQNQG